MSRVIVSVSQNAVIQAELAIAGCVYCAESASMPFWQVLDSFRNYEGLDVVYFLPALGRCPVCRSMLEENTPVAPKRKTLSAPK